MGTNGEAVAVARQPFFDGRRQVLGYEIRSEAPVSGSAIEALAGDLPAFVKITRDQLVTGEIDDVPGTSVLVLPGDIAPAPEVREACADFRRRGFRIALDRYVPHDGMSPLLRYVDYLLTDVPHAITVAQRPIPTIRPTRPPVVAAVGVDTPEQFGDMYSLGCEFFQGEFITRPKLTARSNIPASDVTRLRLMNALQDADLSVMALEELIKPDAALCLRVLRAVNGVAYAQHTRITSLRQALLLVGLGTIREWTTVWTLEHFSQTSPRELIVMASVRGRFCELMSKGSIASTGGDGFLLGMCSLLDAILETPMASILEHLPLCASNEAALQGDHNGQRALLDSVIAWEHGHWEQSRRLAAGAGLDPTLLPAAYQGAIAWMSKFSALAAAA